ncbi:LysR substrate-binding domain-containing protein [Celeribacter halophilus]|uniref:LysR substrate-binding domain-containing protein n=1 Tax=Celeribacter halophilus TaxID=576117 RepID=UPI003A934F47
MKNVVKTAFGKTIGKSQTLRAGLNLRRFTQDLVFLSVDARYGWDACFKNLGASEQRPRSKVEFNSYSLLVNSMLAGHGVGLAWEGLLDSYFETGALVRLSDVQLATNRGYDLFLRDDRKASAKVRKVGEWILSAATAEHSIAV